MIIKKILAACFMLSSAFSLAHDFQVGSLKVDHPFARVTAAGQTNGAAFMEIMNKGKAVDKLLSANSPIAETVEIHSMSMEGDVMKMRAVESLELPSGSNVKLQHGQGYHIMLLGLKKPLNKGEKFPMTLQFEKAGKLKIVVHVEEKSAQHGAEHHH